TFALPTSERIPSDRSDAPALSMKADRDETAIVVERAFQIREKDLLRISGGGVAEFMMVVARDGNTFHLGRRLQGNYSNGTALSVYEAGLRVYARTAGQWGNRIRLQVTPLTTGELVSDFALRVTGAPGDDLAAPTEEEFYSRLSLAKPPEDETNPYL